MARQMGLLPLSGTIDGITFYEHPEDGHLARAKSCLTGEKVLKNPSFKKFLANAMEFEDSIFAGKLLRKALHSSLFLIADGKLTSRMNATLLKIVQSDPVNGFGERRFTKGNIDLLKGFDFNRKYEQDQVFTGSYFTGRDKTNHDLYVSIPPFDIARHIKLPEYASHFQFIAGRAIIDFKKGTYRRIHGTASKVPVNQPVSEGVHFRLPLEPGMEGVDLTVLGIAFFAKLENIPRKAISGRKRMKLKGMVDEDGMVKFSGALKLVKVVRAVTWV